MTPARSLGAWCGGAGIGMLGGLIGLGGAEFRLPLLIGPFGFAALEAVILNKTMSLLVVATALPFRAAHIPVADVYSHIATVVILLCGSLAGAWWGAGWTTRMSSRTLHHAIALLLIGIAAVLLTHLFHPLTLAPVLEGLPLILIGCIAGFGIGVVAAILGVAGGELLIPTIILLFGTDPALAGSLSLLVSLPTMIVSFARYSRDRSFAVVRAQRGFLLVMATGSIVGVWLGSLLLGLIPTVWLLPTLAGILLVSAVKVWQHTPPSPRPASPC